MFDWNSLSSVANLHRFLSLCNLTAGLLSVSLAMITAVLSIGIHYVGERKDELSSEAETKKLKAIRNIVHTFTASVHAKILWSADDGDALIDGENGQIFIQDYLMELSAGNLTNDPAQGLVPFHTMSPYYLERRSAASATFDASFTVPSNRYPIGENAEDLNQVNLLRILIPIKSPVTRLREDAVFSVEQIGIILKINGHAFTVTNPPIRGLLARRFYDVVSYRYLDVRVSLPQGLIKIP